MQKHPLNFVDTVRRLFAGSVIIAVASGCLLPEVSLEVEGGGGISSSACRAAGDVTRGEVTETGISATGAITSVGGAAAAAATTTKFPRIGGKGEEHVQIDDEHGRN